MHRALEPDGDDVGLSVPRVTFRCAREGLERPVVGRSGAGTGIGRFLFAIAVRRLKWLGRIPGLPQLFDSLLFALTGLFRPRRLRAISDIEAAVAQWPGMRRSVHRFGGIGFFVHGAECGHIHGNGLLDCFVGMVNRAELVQDSHALPHHVFPRSGWISFWVEDPDDIEAALALLQLAANYREKAR